MLRIDFKLPLFLLGLVLFEPEVVGRVISLKVELVASVFVVVLDTVPLIPDRIDRAGGVLRGELDGKRANLGVLHWLF